MGTKLNPGNFDCYAAAKDDEPMFVLLARDESAPFLVEAWARLHGGDLVGAMDAIDKAYVALRKVGKASGETNCSKRNEAINCAIEMLLWKDTK